MSRGSIPDVPNNPLNQRQTPVLREIARRVNETTIFSGSGDVDASQGPHGVHFDLNQRNQRDSWFWAVVVDAGPDGTPDGDLDDSTYWFRDVYQIQKAGATGTNVTYSYLNDGDDGIWAAGTHLTEVPKGTNNLKLISASTSGGSPLPSDATIVRVHYINAGKVSNSAADVPNAVFIIEVGGSDATTASLAKVTALTPTSNALPIKYTVQPGHWADASLSDAGTFFSDGGTATAWAGNPSMIPPLPDAIVEVVSSGADEDGNTIYSIIGAPGVFEVFLTKNGGDDGDDGSTGAAASASWTYDVFLDAGKTIQIGTMVAVAFQRLLQIKTHPATKGIARIGTDGTAVGLIAVDEYYDDGDCTDPGTGTGTGTGG